MSKTVAVVFNFSFLFSLFFFLFFRNDEAESKINAKFPKYVKVFVSVSLLIRWLNSLVKRAGGRIVGAFPGRAAKRSSKRR